MSSCHRGCVVGLPSFAVSPEYALIIISIMEFSYSSFYDVLYMLLLYSSALIFFPVQNGGWC